MVGKGVRIKKDEKKKKKKESALNELGWSTGSNCGENGNLTIIFQLYS